MKNRKIVVIWEFILHFPNAISKTEGMNKYNCQAVHAAVALELQPVEFMDDVEIEFILNAHKLIIILNNLWKKHKSFMTDEEIRPYRQQ